LTAARARLSPLAAVAVALAMGVGAAACGDSDDDGDSTAGAASEIQQPRGDGDAGDGAKRARPKGDRRAGPALQGDTEQARAGAVAVDSVYEDLAGAVRGRVAAIDVAVGSTLSAAEGNDGLTRICDLMSEQARRETIVYAQRSSKLGGVDWTCEKATALFLRRTRESRHLDRTLRAEVIGVNAEGDRATATVRFGGPKGRLSTIPLVKEDGRWKLAGSPGGGG
jgi:hypothetical protein